MNSLPDSELLLQLPLNNHFAFEVLFERYWKDMYRVAQARLNDSATAQDIVQEIFIKIWQRRSTLQITDRLENYLMSAVRLRVIDHYRSQKVNPVMVADALDRVNVLESSIEQLSDYIELEKTLQEAVDKMPEMLQKVYELRSENRSIKEIAGELGLADQTVKNYISEVIRRLRLVIIKKHPEKSLTYLSVILAVLYK